MPVAESLGQTAPFAPLLGNGQNGVEHAQIIERQIALWRRQARLGVAILGVGDFHGRMYLILMAISVNSS